MPHVSLVKERGQRVWLWIAMLFGAFYFFEAVLFWGPQPRVTAPPWTRLVFWGLFGGVIICLLLQQARRAKAAATQTPGADAAEIGRVPPSLQSWLVGAGFTIGVVGIAYIAMSQATQLVGSIADSGLAGRDVLGLKAAHDSPITLGHAVMMLAMFEAAMIIAGMSGNIGWMVASLIWAIAAGAVLLAPPWQDWTIGAAVTAGFAAVGALDRSIRSA